MNFKRKCWKICFRLKDTKEARLDLLNYYIRKRTHHVKSMQHVNVRKNAISQGRVLKLWSFKNNHFYIHVQYVILCHQFHDFHNFFAYKNNTINTALKNSKNHKWRLLLTIFFNIYYALVISGSPFLKATWKACTKCRKTFKYGRSYMVVFFFFLSFGLPCDIAHWSIIRWFTYFSRFIWLIKKEIAQSFVLNIFHWINQKD